MQKSCGIGGCGRPYYGKSWCKIHWQRWYRTGDPLKVREIHELHGYSGTREYKIWVGMKSRCLNKRTPRYKDWGGRGIKIHEPWLDSFQNFINDMGFAPTINHSLDRINHNGNYEPDNCRWATGSIQSYNKRSQLNNKSGYRGVYWDRDNSQWRVEIAKEKNRIKIGRYDSVEEAALAYDCAAIQLYGEDARLNLL